MTKQELKAKARRLAEEVYGQGDLAVAEEVVSPDYLHHLSGRSAEPGLAAIRRWVRTMGAALPDVHVIVEDQIADEDLVAQRITVRGSNRFAKTVTCEVIAINRAGPDGRFVEGWSSMDPAAVLAQMGRQT